RSETELMQQRDDRGGIGGIFFSEQLDGKVAQLGAGVPDFELRAVGGSAQPIDTISRERMKTVGDSIGPAREQFRKSRIIGAEDQAAARRFGKLFELLANSFQVRIVIEVLLVDVEDDGMSGLEFAKGSVALVGLDNKERHLLNLTLSPAWGEGIRTAKNAVALQLSNQSANGVARVGT